MGFWPSCPLHFFGRRIFFALSAVLAAVPIMASAEVSGSLEVELPFVADRLEAGPNGTIVALSSEKSSYALVGSDGAVKLKGALPGKFAWIVQPPPVDARQEVVIITLLDERSPAALHLKFDNKFPATSSTYPLFDETRGDPPPNQPRGISLAGDILPFGSGRGFSATPWVVLWQPGVGRSLITDLFNVSAFNDLVQGGPDLLVDLGVKDRAGRIKFLMLDKSSQSLSVFDPLGFAVNDSVRFTGFAASRAEDFDYLTVPVSSSLSDLEGAAFRTLLVDRIGGQLWVLGMEQDDFGVRVGTPSSVKFDNSEKEGRLFVAATPNLSTIIVGNSKSREMTSLNWLRGVFDTSEDREKKLTFETPFRDLVALQNDNSTPDLVLAGLSEDGRTLSYWSAEAFLRAGGREAQPQPSDQSPSLRECVDVSWNPGEIASAQRALTLLGYDVGRIDGVDGPNTRAAIGEFQVAVGLQPSGTIDCSTLEALSDAEPTSVGLEMDEDFVAAFEEYMKDRAGLDAARRLLTMGVSHQDPSNRCFGINSLPPEGLWPNAVRFAGILQLLEKRNDMKIQIVSGFRSPAYNSCVGASRTSANLQFLEFDIRLEGAESYQESSGKIRKALMSLVTANQATLAAGDLQGASVEVKPLIGRYHAQIVTHSRTERGCRFAQDDLSEMAALLEGGELSGRMLSVLLRGADAQNEGGSFVVTVDLHGDRAAASEASEIVRQVSPGTFDQVTGADAYVVDNADLSLTASCNAARIIR